MPAQDYSIHVDVCTVSSVYVRNSDSITTNFRCSTNRLVPFRNRHCTVQVGYLLIDQSESGKGFRGHPLGLLGDQKFHKRPKEHGIPAINLDQGFIHRTTKFQIP